MQKDGDIAIVHKEDCSDLRSNIRVKCLKQS